MIRIFVLFGIVGISLIAYLTVFMAPPETQMPPAKTLLTDFQALGVVPDPNDVVENEEVEHSIFEVPEEDGIRLAAAEEAMGSMDGMAGMEGMSGMQMESGDAMKMEGKPAMQMDGGAMKPYAEGPMPMDGDTPMKPEGQAAMPMDGGAMKRHAEAPMQMDGDAAIKPEGQAAMPMDGDAMKPHAETTMPTDGGEMKPHAETAMPMDGDAMKPEGEAAMQMDGNAMKPKGEAAMQMDGGEMKPHAEATMQMDGGETKPHAETAMQMDSDAMKPHADEAGEQAHADEGEGHGGGAGLNILAEGAPVDREIEIVMTEWSYSPGSIEVKPGERILLKIRNGGEIPHEFMFMSMPAMTAIGYRTQRADWNLLEHEALYERSLVLPGQDFQVAVEIEKSGMWMFMCMFPYHMQFGMMGGMATPGMSMQDMEM